MSAVRIPGEMGAGRIQRAPTQLVYWMSDEGDGMSDIENLILVVLTALACPLALPIVIEVEE